MRQHVEWLWVIGFLGFAAAANAQTTSLPAPNTQFDGTYAPVSAAKVNETYFSLGTNRIGQCPDYPRLNPLIIVNGQARRYRGKDHELFAEGSVGPHGELTMRYLPTPYGRCAGCSAGIDVMVSGRIDGNGTASARQSEYRCQYDLIWQKVIQ